MTLRKVQLKRFNAGVCSSINANIVFAECEFSANVTTVLLTCASSSPTFIGCSFFSNTVDIITGTTYIPSFSDCVFWSNTGGSTALVRVTGIGGIRMSNCAIGTVGSHAIDFQTTLLTAVFQNVYIQGSGGWAINFATATDNVVMYNCGGGNNTSGFYDTTKITNGYDFRGTINTGATDAFTTLASGILTLNNNSPGGAQLRAAAWPSTYPGLSGTNYLDVGAYQHQDAGGGGGGPRPVITPVVSQFSY